MSWLCAKQFQCTCQHRAILTNNHYRLESTENALLVLGDLNKGADAMQNKRIVPDVFDDISMRTTPCLLANYSTPGLKRRSMRKCLTRRAPYLLKSLPPKCRKLTVDQRGSKCTFRVVKDDNLVWHNVT